MGKVVFDMSMSVDGFITGANVRPDQPNGDGGLRLVEWAFTTESERDRELVAQGVSGLGALIAGRRTYDLSVPFWGADGPTGPARRPLFVVTHDVPEHTPEDGIYTFVTDGIEYALQAAQAAAGDKDVAVMGGAELGGQYLQAGLLDEISIHLVPVLFGSGTRMFEHLGDQHIQLETLEVTQTAAATHLRFRVVK